MLSVINIIYRQLHNIILLLYTRCSNNEMCTKIIDIFHPGRSIQYKVEYPGELKHRLLSTNVRNNQIEGSYNNNNNKTIYKKNIQSNTLK